MNAAFTLFYETSSNINSVLPLLSPATTAVDRKHDKKFPTRLRIGNVHTLSLAHSLLPVVNDAQSNYSSLVCINKTPCSCLTTPKQSNPFLGSVCKSLMKLGDYNG